MSLHAPQHLRSGKHGLGTPTKGNWLPFSALLCTVSPPMSQGLDEGGEGRFDSRLAITLTRHQGTGPQAAGYGGNQASGGRPRRLGCGALAVSVSRIERVRDGGAQTAKVGRHVAFLGRKGEDGGRLRQATRAQPVGSPGRPDLAGPGRLDPERNADGLPESRASRVIPTILPPPGRLAWSSNSGALESWQRSHRLPFRSCRGPTPSHQPKNW